MVPCLDKGYVELIGCSPSGKELENIIEVSLKGRVSSNLLKSTMLHFRVKAPYFVVMSMGNIRYITDAHQTSEVYTLELDDLGCKDLDTAKDILFSINSTIEATNINREMYIKDGCNRFVATMTSTTSTYWSGIMYADMDTWCDFYKQKHAPHQINTYQKAIEQILKVEYPRLDDYLRRRQ